MFIVKKAFWFYMFDIYSVFTFRFSNQRALKHIIFGVFCFSPKSLLERMLETQRLS